MQPDHAITQTSTVPVPYDIMQHVPRIAIETWEKIAAYRCILSSVQIPGKSQDLQVVGLGQAKAFQAGFCGQCRMPSKIMFIVYIICFCSFIFASNQCGTRKHCRQEMSKGHIFTGSYMLTKSVYVKMFKVFSNMFWKKHAYHLNMFSCKPKLGTCWWSWHLYVPVVRVFVDLRSQNRYPRPRLFWGKTTRKWTPGLCRLRMISNLLFNFVNLSYALCKFWPQREDAAKHSRFVKVCEQVCSGWIWAQQS